MIPLSPLDHFFTGAAAYSIDFLFHYGAMIDGEKLKNALRELARFFPIAARLAEKDGALFLVSDEKPYYEFSERAASTRPASLSSAISIPGQALFKMELCHTPEGSTLGVSLSHAVGDGFSYFYLLSTLAKILRGEHLLPSFQATLPNHQRTRLIPAPADKPAHFTPETLWQKTGFHWQPGTSRESVAPSLAWRTTSFNRSAFKEARQSFVKDERPDLSDNAILVAQLWQQFATRSTESGDTELFITCPVDFRRLYAEIPPTYVGNAIQPATAALTKEKILAASVQDLAHRIRESIANIKPARIPDFLRTLHDFRREFGWAAYRDVYVVHPTRGLLVTNLSRLPMRELDFGAGAPLSFAALSPTPGAAAVLAAADGFEVHICEAGRMGLVIDPE